MSRVTDKASGADSGVDLTPTSQTGVKGRKSRMKSVEDHTGSGSLTVS